LRIANPYGGRLRAGFPAGMINRVGRDYGRGHALEFQLTEIFSDKAAAHFVPFGGIKGRERQNVQLGWYIFVH